MITCGRSLEVQLVSKSRVSRLLPETLRSNKRYYSNGRGQVPAPYNEPIHEYLKGSKERTTLEHTILEMRKEVVGIYNIIGS